MRLAFVSVMRGAPWGGSEELWAAAARCALADGHDVLISVFDWPERHARIKELERSGAVILPRPLRPSRVTSLLAPPRWLRDLEAWKPGAICLSQGGPYECVGRRATRPLLKWLRRWRKSFVNVVQYAAESATLKPRTRELSRDLYGLAASNAFVAKANAAAVERQIAAPIPRAVIVQNPVNLADVSELPWPPGDPARFACVARLHTDAKGQDLLFHALATPEWKSRDWSLSLFGEGRDRESLEALAAQLSLTDRVRFRGHVSDIRAVWTDHHLLILPSRNEGTPLALLEAMLLGRPAIATAVGGAPDWIRDGGTGFLAAGASIESIGQALERAWSVRSNWPKIGAAARVSALAQRDTDPGRTLLSLLIRAAEQPPSV